MFRYFKFFVAINKRLFIVFIINRIVLLFSLRVSMGISMCNNTFLGYAGKIFLPNSSVVTNEERFLRAARDGIGNQSKS